MKISRRNLLTRADVHNIKTQYGTVPSSKTSNDLISVDLWVADLKEKTSYYVICHKNMEKVFTLVSDNTLKIKIV